MARKVMTKYVNENITQIQWTPIEETYMMELICGLKCIKDKSFLSSFGLFDINVRN